MRYDTKDVDRRKILMKNFHVTGNCILEEYNMVDTSDKVNKIHEQIPKKITLFIDEVDRASNYVIF